MAYQVSVVSILGVPCTVVNREFISFVKFGWGISYRTSIQPILIILFSSLESVSVDGRHDSFFLLLDPLDETLDQRIATWTKEAASNALEDHKMPQQTHQGLVSGIFKRLSMTTGGNPEMTEHDKLQEQKRRNLYLEKLGIATEIASALCYLHEMGVIYRGKTFYLLGSLLLCGRYALCGKLILIFLFVMIKQHRNSSDLKPNNIGFLKSRVQLFDFGLSRELPQLDAHMPFEMSGKVGTLRYMAVEVAMHRAYNVGADVYSWSMVCYGTPLVGRNDYIYVCFHSQVSTSYPNQ